MWPGDANLEDANAESDLKFIAKIANAMGQYAAAPSVQF